MKNVVKIFDIIGMVDMLTFETEDEARKFARSVNSGENETYRSCWAEVTTEA